MGTFPQKSRFISDANLQWLIKHFKHTKNDEICAKIGISLNYLHTLARRHGLKKTRQFMQKTQRAASAAGVVAISQEDDEAKERRRQQARENGAKNRFKVGQWSLRNKTPEELAEIMRKKAEAWKKVRHEDEVRLNWGYETKTKFRFARCQDRKQNKAMMSLRCNMRKLGYEIEKGSMVIYITPDTKRRKLREKHAAKFGFLIRERVAA